MALSIFIQLIWLITSFFDIFSFYPVFFDEFLYVFPLNTMETLLKDYFLVTENVKPEIIFENIINLIVLRKV